MALSLRARRALLFGFSILSLAACHGGGDDDNTIGGIVGDEDEDATGLWLGTMVLTSGGTRTFRAMVAPSGEFNALIFPSTAAARDSRTLLGVGDVSGADFSATGNAFVPPGGTAFPNNSFIAPLTIAGGRVAERVTITGTYTAGGEVGTFTLAHQTALTARGASLQTLAGTYTVLPVSSGATATVTVDSTGAATFNASDACVGNGTFAVIDPALNMYTWTMTLASCQLLNGPQSGLAALDDFNGSQRNLLAMYGSPPARQVLFAFVGSK